MCHRRTRETTSSAETSDERTTDASVKDPSSGVVKTPVRALKRAVALVKA
jgi:hypothetical protein